MEERIQKILSRRGMASRRASEELIAAGRVTINGRAALIGDRADAARDTIEIDGKPIAPEGERVYIMLNKPRGYITAMSDDRGRSTVADLLRDCQYRVYPVGRLDYNSDGLLIMTNDGALAHRLTHPGSETEKEYCLYVRGDADAALEGLRSPLVIDGYEIRPARVEIIERTGNGGVLSVTIHEGRNRQIRRMCEQCGLEVRRLTRVREGGLPLGKLKPGKWRYLTDKELALLTT